MKTTSSAGQTSLKVWFGPVLLALLANSGQLKETVLFRWLPVDLTLLLGVLVIGAMLGQFITKRINLKPAIPLLLFIFLVIPSMISGGLEGYAETKTITFLAVTIALMLSPLFLLTSREKELNFFLSLLLVSLVAAALMVTSPASVGEYTTRIVFDGTNTIGASRVMGAGVIVALVQLIWGYKSKWGSALLTISTIVLIWGMLSSGARGPMVALLVGILILTITGLIRRGVKARIVAATVFLAFGVLFAISRSSSDGVSRIIGFFQGDRDTSTDARQVMWDVSISTIKENPFGVGFGRFNTLSEIDNYPHNALLETFVESGWAAGIVLICIIVLALYRAVRNAYLNTDLMVLGLLVFTVSNAMVSNDLNGNRLMWIVITMALARVIRGRAEST